MEYEKLKELEESGFPAKGKFACPECDYPTTDELIEQLGDKYWKLIKEDDDFLAYQRGSITYFKGKTPKEALINLYIAVNKK